MNVGDYLIYLLWTLGVEGIEGFVAGEERNFNLETDLKGSVVLIPKIDDEQLEIIARA